MPATHMPVEPKQTVEPIIEVDGLLALVAAAQILEQRVNKPTVDWSALDSDREKRKMEVYMRRFEEIRQPLKRQRLPQASSEGRLVGKTLRKTFNDEHGVPREYTGKVVSVSYSTKECPFDFGAGVTATVKYLVQYEDGDAEDMMYFEVLRHLVQ